MRRAVRIIAVFALVFIPFLACMDLGGGEDEGCEPVELPPLCLFGDCEPDPCEGVVCPRDDNVCTREYCSNGSCRSTPVTNGRSCTYDGLSGVCVAGVCGENLCEDVSCDDDACTEGTCDYIDGMCDFTPVVCSDFNQCTEDTCDSADGCVFTAVEDGTECGTPAYGMCQAGDCVAPCDLASEEEYQCPITGLEDLFCCPGQEHCRDDCFVPECQTPEDCDDNNECTEDNCDYANGTCYFTPAVCNDDNPCTEGTCDPVDGCIFTAVEDGTECGTPGWVCVAGECVATCESPEDCDDDNECTEDVCTNGTCTNSALDDGTVCTEGECRQGVCGLVFACTEQGIRDAIAEGEGPHFFACDGPTTVVTEGEILIDNDVILDGVGNLTVDAGGTHRVFSIPEGVTAELIGFTVTGGSTAGDGGGIFCAGNCTVTSSIVSDNRTARFGGGIRNLGVANVIDTTVSNNTAVNGAAGISNGPTGIMTIDGSTVQGNTASGNGGGIGNFQGTITVTNTTVSGNESAGNRAGITNGESGSMTLVNTTVSGNIAADGATGVWNFASLSTRNTIIDGGCGTAPLTLPIDSLGGNIESPGDNCGFTEPIDQVNVSAEDLKLGPLQDNGGPTMTHALLPGSVAIDRIADADCAVDTDQRGEPRPETGGDACDVGAFERQPDDPEP